MHGQSLDQFLVNRDVVIHHCYWQKLIVTEKGDRELRAGRPMKKGNRRGAAYAYNVKTLRNQEMAIAEQAERAYEHFVGQWRQKPTIRRARAAPVTGSS